MNTTYYTLTTWEENAMAAGFSGETHQAVLSCRQPRTGRPAGGDNVIDLSAWRAANQELWDEPQAEDGDELDQPCWEAETPELPPRRVRRSRRSMLTAELVSTLCVAAVSAVLILRVLMF